MSKQELNTPYAKLLPPLSTQEKEALKASIKTEGVRDPIVIDESNNILDGHHRYAVCPNVPTRLMAGLSETEKQAYVFSVNLARRNLSPDQKREARRKMQAVAKALREEDPKKNTQARVAALLGVTQQAVSLWFDNGTNTSACIISLPDARVKVPPKERPVIFQRSERGESATQIAADYGISERQARNIINAESNNLSSAKSLSMVIHEGHAMTIEELLDLGIKFRTIYADPPWSYSNQATRAATDNHYETWSIEKICKFPVQELVDQDAHLHLWTTNAFLFEVPRVMEAWGFTYKSVCLWVKPQMGIGNYWRVCHEFLFFGLRGSLKMQDERKTVRSWYEEPRVEHSAKPAKFRELVEQVSYPPRLELFGRAAYPGWTVFGNEIIGANMYG